MEVVLLVLGLVNLFATIFLAFMVLGTYQKVVELEKCTKKDTGGNPLATMSKYQHQYKEKMDAKELEIWFDELLRKSIENLKRTQP